MPAPRPRVVGDSPDFRRVRALPQREVTLAAGEAASDLLTPELTTPAGKRNGARLRPWQALGLLELMDHGGAFLGLSAGSGKTLITFLAPVVMQAKRPLLIVPGKLVEDTQT